MKTLKITLVFCLFTLFIKAQTVYTVDNRVPSGAQYQDLQTAIDAAASGDIIHILPSPTTYGSVTINKQLKLIGLGHDPLINSDGYTAKLSTINFTGNSANSTITGLDIYSIYKSNPINHIENIHIVNNKISLINIGSVTGGLANSWLIEGNYITNIGTCITSSITSNNWVIRNNFMHGGVSNLNVTNVLINNIFYSNSNNTSVNFFINCDAIIIANNIFFTNSNMTEFAQYNCTNLVFSNNLTYSYVGNTITAFPGTTNLNNTNPQFVSITASNEGDFYNNDYHLMANALGHNFGTDGTDIGVYGGNYNFDPQGRPNAMPYPISITINNPVIAPGQTLNVDFSAAQKQ